MEPVKHSISDTLHWRTFMSSVVDPASDVAMQPASVLARTPRHRMAASRTPETRYSSNERSRLR